jgi:hypothetical protein
VLINKGRQSHPQSSDATILQSIKTKPTLTGTEFEMSDAEMRDDFVIEIGKAHVVKVNISLHSNVL